jgi:CBS-domain-containing membrane protein
MIAAFIVISLIRAYHPPGVALAMIPILLKTGPWFSLSVVLPFTTVAVLSAAAMSKWNSGWLAYPKPLRDAAVRSSVAKRTTTSEKGISGQHVAFPEGG